MPLPIGQLSMKSYLLKREISFSLRKFFEHAPEPLVPNLLISRLLFLIISTELFWKEFVMNIIVVTKI